MQETDLIDKMAAGYSTQAKTANQFWLVLIVSAILVLITQPKENQFTLPFSLGSVNSDTFYLVMTTLNSALLVAFASALTQAIRTRQLIQDCIKLLKSQTFDNGIFVQDYLDGIVTPTYNRVAPISQITLGRIQFLHHGKQKTWRRTVGGIFYIVLKLFSYVFMYGIPVWALYISYTATKISETTNLPFIEKLQTPIVVVAVVCSLVLVITDFNYTFRVLTERIFSKKQPNENVTEKK